MAALIEPIGFTCRPDGARLAVTVPTFRPDVRPAPHGIDDVIEEVGRTFGYSRPPRRQPSWPEPGGLTERQRDRRRVRDVWCGLGATEAWTPTFVTEADHARMGLSGPSVAVTNPLVAEESRLRRSMLPGLLRAVAYNADRRQGSVRLFEVGTVFTHPDAGGGRPVARAGAGGRGEAVLPGERELLSVVLAGAGDDAIAAVAGWRVLAEALRVDRRAVRLVADETLPGLHPTRSARLVVEATGTVLGTVGEVDPAVEAQFGLGGPAWGVGDGELPLRRTGWLEVDLELLLDPSAVARRPEQAVAVSRFPSSDVDLALVVDESLPADRVAEVLEEAGGDLLESVTLFDVFRGASIGPGRRSLAFRLRFCAPERTLTDAEVGELRQAAIDAAGARLGAALR